MNAVFLMFDSLNRDKLSAYGCTDVLTPNFKRFEKKCVTFDNCFAGSLPCIPARRELHTGRSNFLHRSWGPLEPFDDSMPEILKNNGVLSHLISDHSHYWEDGGSTYHILHLITTVNLYSPKHVPQLMPSSHLWKIVQIWAWRP